MNNKVTPYNTAEDKKKQVENMFDAVAWRYDFLNRLLSLGIDMSWRRKLIKQMKAYKPKLVLDMATGTADLAIMTAKRIEDARVIGIDLSKNMLLQGDKKVVEASLSDRIELQQGDSENIQHPDDTFGAAMVAFGVRNFENLDKGLEELHRVIKPGAPLFILEFSRPTIFPIKQLFNFYFKWILPTIGGLLSKDKRAYHYLYESVQVFPDYDQMTQRLTKIGFKECTWESLGFGICCLYRGVK